MERLSRKQKEIYDFILKEIQKRGYPPSVREIGKAVNLKSSSTVHGHLSRLEKKGYIRRDPTKPRAIEILDKSSAAFPTKEMVNIPIVGKVTAGEPILANENIEDYFPLPIDFLQGSQGDIFMLAVRGESMINAGILDGDLVMVRRQNTANNGDIVVALVGDEEATVKRFFKENGYIRLQPENPSMAPILVKDVTILGKVEGLVRRFH